MPNRLHVHIRGRVQGVGFRFSTVRHAEHLHLAGWVRNCPDGSVEAEFEGPKQALEEMLDWCRHGPRMALVEDIQTDWSTGESNYDAFRVRH